MEEFDRSELGNKLKLGVESGVSYPAPDVIHPSIRYVLSPNPLLDLLLSIHVTPDHIPLGHNSSRSTMSSTDSAMAVVIRLALEVGLILDTGFKVALANALSSFVTALAYCEHTRREEGCAYLPAECSSQACSTVIPFESYLVYNTFKGASLVQFAALYTALRLHFDPVKNARSYRNYVHMALCAVWVYATHKGEPVGIICHPTGTLMGWRRWSSRAPSCAPRRISSK